MRMRFHSKMSERLRRWHSPIQYRVKTFGSATKSVDRVDLDPVDPREAMLLIAEPDNPQLEIDEWI